MAPGADTTEHPLQILFGPVALFGDHHLQHIEIAVQIVHGIA
jgi:hypothetical protein